MEKIIDDLGRGPGMLRSVTLAGPQVPGKNGTWPLWILHAGAPYFGWKHARDTHDKKIGATADHVHPVRVLVAENPADESAKAAEKWMRPRLLDLHLVVGAKNDHYRQRMDDEGNYIDKDQLLLGWNEDGKEIAVDRGKALHSITEGIDESARAAPFVHVVAQVLDGVGQDRFKHAGGNMIAVPPLRLLAGRVGLHVNLGIAGLAWLRGLGIDEESGIESNWAKIWLVPDGIEFDAKLPFPGRLGAKHLQGRVLLNAEPATTGFALRLRLLAAAEPAAWSEAWGAIIPESGDSSERLLGLRFAGRRGDTLPEFSWPVLCLSSGEPAKLGPLEVAGSDVQISLVSPEILGAIDSVAALRAQRIQVTDVTLDGGVPGVQFAFAEGLDTLPKDSISLKCHCKRNTLAISCDSTLELDFDLGRLVPELRTAYGIATPPAVPVAGIAGMPFGSEYGRPLIPAFVALDNGWLQLPVPNLGPIDTSSDKVLAGALPTAAPRNVLDGFLRLRRVGITGVVQSGFNPTATPLREGDAPWSFTVEQAAAVECTVCIRLEQSHPAQLEDATVVLHGPILSTRGLLWLSADRPDAQEALPRLGAGPGSFIDVVMVTPELDDADRSALSATLSNLVLEANRIPSDTNQTPIADRKSSDTDLTQNWDDMQLSFRTDSKRWVDELLKPEEARTALVESARCIDKDYASIPGRNDRRRILMGAVDDRVDAMRAQLVSSDIERRATLTPLAQLSDDPVLARTATNVSKQLEAARGTTETTLKAVGKAQVALEDARRVLPNLTLTRQKPWPAVAWLRHPTIPLAACMPMTRAAGGSQRPLESRDLHPYAVRPTELKEVMQLAVLARSDTGPLMILHEVGGMVPLPSWPRASGPDNSEGVTPDRGIGFASVGVPGVELRMLAKPGKPEFEAALRYDLPLLDEAFATAALPPAEGAPAQLATGSVPTALDWPLLTAFWGDQERKHQNSRVVDSYLSGFLGHEDKAQPVDITTLVRGLTWSTKLRIGHHYGANVPPELPYGSLTLGATLKDSHGNKALAGYDGGLVLKGKMLREPNKAEISHIHLLGYSPATFHQDGVDLDNAMSGAGTATWLRDSILLRRPVTVAGVAGQQLVSLVEPINTTINGVVFMFWFKDLLFKGGVAQLKGDPAVAFDIFDNDESLARGGAEWRFAPAEKGAAEAALRLGRCEIPFFGFRLEPLRLTELKLTADAVASVKLLCRLTLEPRADSSNLIEMTLSSLGKTAMTASFKVADEASPLQFELRAWDDLRPRRVLVTARCATGAKFALKGLGLGVDVAGVMVGVGRPAIVSAGKSGEWKVVIRSTPKPTTTGTSCLRIKHACVSAGYLLGEDGQLENLPVKLDWNAVIELFAKDEVNEVDDRAPPLVIWPLMPEMPLVLLGMTAGDTSRVGPPDEANGALSGVLKAEFKAAAGAADASVRAGLVVRLGVPGAADGTVQLAAGQCEGLLQQGKDNYAGGAGQLCGTGINVKDARLHFSLGTNDKGIWVGQATVDAMLHAENDIVWPALDTGAWPAPIPLPETKRRPLSGRVLVSHEPDTAVEPASHSVIWTLAGHRLPLGIVASILRPRSTAVWVTPVMVRHTLVRGDKTLNWTGVESIAVGRPAGLVPSMPVNLNGDATTFAARYKQRIVNGKADSMDEGMRRAGAGAIATVLQGSLGATFRTLWSAHWDTTDDTVMIAGGFVGLLKIGQNDIADPPLPLLRLPVLVGLGIKIEQNNFAGGIELAWNDGPAARAVALTRPTAPSPANASSEALAAALLAGSLTGQMNDAAVTELTGAVLVEQSFDVRPQLDKPTLKGTPFFLAAAVSVNALLNSAPAKDRNNSRQLDVYALSLVAGTLKRIVPGSDVPDVMFAAAVGMRAVTTPATLEAQELPTRPPSNSLYVLGSRVRRQSWVRASPSSLDYSMTPYLRAIAVTLDPDPVGFLLASYNGADGAAYLHGTIASMALDRGFGAQSAITAEFADGSRGAPTMPKQDKDILRWLAPPCEGPGMPIRDEGSGLAGLARRLTLPPSATKPIDLSLKKPLMMVWLSYTQVPVYLPLQIKELSGEPIGWLQPATPRVRLPVDTEVVSAILESAPRITPREESETGAAANASDTPQAQPFMPSRVAGASTGERAGIMTLRRVRMLARLDGVAADDAGAYDAVNSRFGAPAQAGASFARKLRTPRPMMLPSNSGDAARDRRIQASMVRPLLQASALLGSADIVQGGPGSFGEEEGKDDHFQGWAIEVVASPETASVVSERWDGSVRLVCRIVVRRAPQQPPKPMSISPAAFLLTALGLGDGISGARLKIGDHLLTYRWLALASGAEQVKWTDEKLEAPDKDAAGWTWCMASIALTLDSRPVWLPLKAQPPAVLAEITRAFAESAVLPPVELQWSFLPGSTRKPQTVPTGKLIELDNGHTKQRRLVEGDDERAPLTLRMPLYPVVQSRGSLPLIPSTLIFSDPAYDRDLANPPASTVDKLKVTGNLDKRGDLRLVLSADRGRVNRRGVVTLMLDIAYERRMDELAQAVAEANGSVPAGDLQAKGALLAGDSVPLRDDDMSKHVVRVTLKLLATSGNVRDLKLGGDLDVKGKPAGSDLLVKLATVYEMPLTRLVETDGKPADLQPGDVLQVSAALLGKSGETEFKCPLWNTEEGKFTDVVIALTPVPTCTLALTLTDEAVVEPPPALYLALQRSQDKNKNWRLAMPLHAQSPLPRRVDLMDPARGFRTGMMRRHADFVWYLMSTATMLGFPSLAVHKSDRNGQGYWPDTVAEFLILENFDVKEGAKHETD